MGTAWSAVMGVLPHVLHHVGPLAGAAIVAGTTGTVIFGLAAFVFTIPLLMRVQRHSGSWRPAVILLAMFVSVWLVSTFVAGPWIRDQLVDEPAATTSQESDRDDGRSQNDGGARAGDEHDGHHEPGEPR